MMATIDPSAYINDELLSDVLDIATSDLSKDERLSRVQQVFLPKKGDDHPNFEIKEAKDDRAYSILKSTLVKRLSDEIERVIDDSSLDDIEDMSLIGANEAALVEFFRKRLLQRLSLTPSQASMLEGSKKRMEMLEVFGGLFSSKDVAALLGYKRQTVVDKLKRKELLGVKIGGSYEYPAFQFEDHNIIPGLSKVIKVLCKKDEMFWDACLFLLNPHDALFDDAEKNITPLEAIKLGNADFVVQLAAGRHDLSAN
ncbi:MAG: helix-turn-helix domain-containing protein [Proteobacteria bacterium]|nr:helix-turn-helix domain-containing protein [Pseudomonadota bacterium]